MDPLSITASAITLIGAANKITTSLYSFVKAHKNVDSRITSLCDELESLEKFLEAVDRTLKGCRSPDLARVDDDLCRQSEFALVDCQVTLNGLAALVEKIKEKSRAKGFAWRTRAVVDLSIHGSELSTFQDKIHKSNWALQTMLHTITVSLSLRSSASQEMVLLELDRLKSSIDEALRAAVRPAGGFIHDLNDRSDARVARNLRNLAEAAKHFHSEASSTASTIRDGSVAPWHGHSGWAPSLAGDLPPFRRERVEMFIHGGLTHSPGEQTPLHSSSLARPHRSVPRPSSLVPALELAHVSVPNEANKRDKEDEEEEDADDEAEYERLFIDGLEELAKDNIKVRDYSKAIEFLKEAMEREVGSSSDNTDFQHLQIQLALCHFLRREWTQAEPIISGLAKSKPRQDLIISNLLHALSLAYLLKYSFDKALLTCKEALQIKKRLLKKGAIKPSDYGETLGLMSTIFDMTGDYIRAEVFQRQLPEGFIYQHPASEIDFIIRNTNLLNTVFGEYTPIVDIGVASFPECYEMDASSVNPVPSSPHEGNVSPLKTKLDQYLRYEMDTAKEVVFSTPNPAIYVDADEECNATSSTNGTSSLGRRLTRVFGTRRLQHNDPKPLPQYIKNPVSSPESPTSPDAPTSLDSPQRTVSPVKQWFRDNNLLGFNKSKTLRRKNPHDGIAMGIVNKRRKPKTFNLIKMEQIVVDKLPDTATHDPQNFTRQYDYCWPTLGNNTAPVNFGLDSPISTRLNRSRQSDTSHNDTGKVPDDRVRTNRVVPMELDSSMILELETLEPCNGRQLRIMTGSPSTAKCSINQTRLHLAEPAAIVCNSHATRDKSIGATQFGSSTNCRGTAEIATHLEKDENSIHSSSGRRSRFPARRDHKMPAVASVPDELQSSLKHMASILASLPALKDDEKRCAAKLELEILCRSLGTLSNDRLLCADLQRVIRSLGETENRVPDGPATDSGYESMESEGCLAQDALRPRVQVPGMKAALLPAKMPDSSARNRPSPHTLHIPVLRRKYSWEEDQPPKRRSSEPE